MVNKKLYAIAIAGLFVLGFTGLSSLGALPNIYANTTYPISGTLDNNLCMSNGGSWVSGTCTTSDLVHWVIASSTTLTIPQGTTLVVEGYITVFGNGILDNLGTINIHGGLVLIGTVDNVGSIFNYGYVEVFNGALVSGNPITNVGSGYIQGDFTVSGSLNQSICTSNGGTWVATSATTFSCTIGSHIGWEVIPASALTIPASTTLVNYGSLYNYNLILNNGAIDNYRTIVNEPITGVRSTPGTISGNPVVSEPGSELINSYDVSGTLDSTGALCTSSGGSWDAGTSTCTPQPNIFWGVPETLTIDSGVTLAFEGSNTGISVTGTLVNKGIISISNGGILSTSIVNFATGVTQYGAIDNSGTIENSGFVENIATITNSGTLDNYNYLSNRGSISNTGSIINEASGSFHNYVLIANPGTGIIENSGALFEYCGSAITGNPVSGVAPVNECPTTVVSSTTTTISNGGASSTSGQTSSTGVSVVISGSSASTGTSVTITIADLSSSGPGVTPSILGSASYYDVSLFGISSGTALVCVNTNLPSSGLTMQYWDGSSWVSASTITTPTNEVCGYIPVSALTGTNIVIGNSITVPTPQFPFGTILGVFVPIAALALFAGEKRFRRPLA